jgi:MFS family permease
MINPAYILLADDLNVTVTKASYLTTVYILFSGITPMFLVPYANVYGRRNLYVVSDCAIFLSVNETVQAHPRPHRSSLSSLQYRMLGLRLRVAMAACLSDDFSTGLDPVCLSGLVRQRYAITWALHPLPFTDSRMVDL